MKSILSVFILILFASCHGFRSSGSASSGQDRGVKQVIVASYRTDCFALTAQSCYLIKQNQEDEWKFYYNELAGFDYEEGYEYVISVKQKRNNNNINDASDVEYELIEVISKVKKEIKISPLYDTWGLLELNGEAIEIGRLARSPLVDINTLKKIIQGSTGCNSFSTGFQYNDDEGTFKVNFPFALTKMACPDYSIEDDFLKALESVDHFKISGVDLYFLSNGKVVLKYRKVD